MIVNFNIEKLDQLLLDFYTLTGLTISVWDATFRQLSFQPKTMPDFCRIIKTSPEGRQRCFQCDKTLCSKSLQTDTFVSHYCHAGLIDTAIPIRYQDVVLGYIMFGQVTDRPLTKELQSNISALAKEIGVSPSVLLSAYEKLDKYNPDILPSAANVLKSATRYLWLSDHIEIVNNDLSEQIDTFIRTHYNEPLSVRLLCDVFQISKNKLYNLFHKQFHATVSDYISEIRSKEAAQLLISTELSVQEISVHVGIPDYNYFTKVFKKHLGTTPHKYRKTYPLI